MKTAFVSGAGGFLGLHLVEQLLGDNWSDKPFLRKVIQRLPNFIKPKPEAYGHIIALDATGNVIKNFQDPDTEYPKNTSVMETDQYLYIGSLVAPVAARLSKDHPEF